MLSIMLTATGIKKKPYFFQHKLRNIPDMTLLNDFNQHQQNNMIIPITLEGMQSGNIAEMHSPARQIPNTIANCVKIFIVITSV